MICLWLASWLTTGFGPPVFTDGGYPPVRLYPDQIAAMQAARRAPAMTAASALLFDVDSGQTLLAWHPDEPLPPASTAKLMTALLVLQRLALTDTVTVSPTAAATDGSRMGLTAGEQLTVQELLWGLLLPSGNDAAVALAERVSGSEAAFVEQMNQAAAGMGLARTHFANAHGLDVEGQVSTAAELLKIARADLAYPIFAEIVATPSKQVAGHALTNTNQLLGSYPGADGIKTGTTDSAGECLVASVTRNGHRLILVLLNSRDRYADANALLGYAAANWQWRPVALPDDALAWESGPDGHTYRLQADTGHDLFLPAWQWSMVRPVRAIDASAAFTNTVQVGELRMTLDGRVLGSVPLRIWPGP